MKANWLQTGLESVIKLVHFWMFETQQPFYGMFAFVVLGR